MNNLEFMRTRLMHEGGIRQEDRMIKSKWKTLDRAVLYSYQACDIAKIPYELTVLEKTDMRSSDGCIMWKCKCECGNITYVNSNSLKRGDIVSCGCLRSKGEQK